MNRVDVLRLIAKLSERYCVPMPIIYFFHLIVGEDRFGIHAYYGGNFIPSNLPIIVFWGLPDRHVVEEEFQHYLAHLGLAPEPHPGAHHEIVNLGKSISAIFINWGEEGEVVNYE